MKQIDLAQKICEELNQFIDDNIARVGHPAKCRRWRFADGASYMDADTYISIPKRIGHPYLELAEKFFNSKAKKIEIIGPYRCDKRYGWKINGQYFVDVDYGRKYDLWSPSKFRNSRHKIV